MPVNLATARPEVKIWAFIQVANREFSLVMTSKERTTVLFLNLPLIGGRGYPRPLDYLVIYPLSFKGEVRPVVPLLPRGSMKTRHIARPGN